MCRHPFAHRRARQLALLLGACLLPLLAAAYCDEPASADQSPMSDNVAASAPERNGLLQLATLAREAVGQSAEVRGAQHGSRAGHFDLQQTVAGGAVNVSLGGNAGIGQSSVANVAQAEGRTGGVSLNLSAPLYDGGRQDELTRYRERLAAAGDLGVGQARERVVRDAVATLLERNRYRQQLRVYQQYVAKMSCLTRSLEQIVSLDRGRSSELLQARKGQRQAELAREDALTALRQADARLRLLVGDNVEPWGAVGQPLQAVPELARVIDEIAASPDVRQLHLQAEALDSYARASRAEGAPQLRWQVGTTTAHSAHINTASWNAGVTFNVTLDDGGAVSAATSAALERAQAARRQEESVVQERIRQASTLHDTARSAYARAVHMTEVLRDSDLVRNATYEQWSKLGRRSLFDLMSAEAEHFQLRIAHVNAVHDGYAAVAQLRSAGAGLLAWIAPELVVALPAR
jgi:adhesin transport system outer membrane protein